MSTYFFTGAGTVRAVDDVSFDLDHGETLGLVGESGCGKSATALSLARLVDSPGRIVGGEVLFDGVDVLSLPEAELERLRGRKIGFIFQDPMTSLNPVLSVGRQISERTRTHLRLSRRGADDLTAELLAKVGIPNPRERMADYPHQFSGGMRQRVMVAMALSCDPVLLLADEPTTALDVTIQAQILELIRSLSAEFKTAVILITHDLGIAAGMCDRVNVMYAGRVVETARVDDIFDSPRMPYAWGLLDSLPRLDEEQPALLPTIDGMPPDLIDPPDACRFSPRCSYAEDVCFEQEPELVGHGQDHFARCWGTAPGGWIR